MSATVPTLYISHGSPMLVLETSEARDFLAAYGRELGRPRAILVASAHFETETPALSADAQPSMIYDFGGFPQALYDVVYAAPGDPQLASRAADLLTESGMPARLAAGRGFDHGTWIPLKLLYPDADIPVVQISIQPRAGAAHHIAMGRALAPLREDGVLIIGSGSLTHNLSELGQVNSAAAPDWVRRFADWVSEKVSAGSIEDIARYRDRAPLARENHPTEEHFLPLPFALGAAGEGARGERLHTSLQYGVLMMDVYAFR